MCQLSYAVYNERILGCCNTFTEIHSPFLSLSLSLTLSITLFPLPFTSLCVPFSTFFFLLSVTPSTLHPLFLPLIPKEKSGGLPYSLTKDCVPQMRVTVSWALWHCPESLCIRKPGSSGMTVPPRCVHFAQLPTCTLWKSETVVSLT